MLPNEECWVLFGGHGRWAWHARYDRYTIGQPATVAFDPDYVWENRDRLIGWIHTHPHWPGSPSSTDHTTMKAQCVALGRPLLCAIEGTDGLRAHWYLDEDTAPIETRIIRIRNKMYGGYPNGYHAKVRARRVLSRKGTAGAARV